MSDPFTIGATGLGAASSAFNLLKSFVDVRDQAKVLELKVELMGLLVDAQTAQAALIEEKRELAERIRELEAWDREKERYHREKIGPHGSWVMALKPDANAPEDDHKLCATCFEQGHPSTLQPHTIPEGRAQVLVCHQCGSQILMKGVAETRVVLPARPRGGAWGRERP